MRSFSVRAVAARAVFDGGGELFTKQRCLCECRRLGWQGDEGSSVFRRSLRGSVECGQKPQLHSAAIDDLPETSYVHLTANNTIYGTEYPDLSRSLMCRLSAICPVMILSRRVNVADFDLIYAGAQKNLRPHGGGDHRNH